MISRTGICPLWAISGAWRRSTFTLPTSRAHGGILPFILSRWTCWTSTEGIGEERGWGAATINREMATLKHALSKAVEWKLLRKTAREELAAIKKYQEPDGRLRYLSEQTEADRLLQACDASLRPIVLTAIHTGMRK